MVNTKCSSVAGCAVQKSMSLGVGSAFVLNSERLINTSGGSGIAGGGVVQLPWVGE